MKDRAEALNTALNLMTMALTLLDDIGERLPAIDLQHAIDVLTDAPVPRTIEEAEAMLDTPEARAMRSRLCS
jgi:hypothetical protein